MTKKDQQKLERYKELRRLVKCWIRAHYVWYLGGSIPRDPTHLPNLLDAEEKLRVAMTGESDHVYAALVVGSPVARKGIRRYRRQPGNEPLTVKGDEMSR